MVCASAYEKRGILTEKLHASDEKFCETTEDVKSYSGYYKLNTGDKNYFYWAFESRNDPANDPVVLWHTGGPGCSGMLALVVENGPCHLSEDGLSSSLNPYSWNNSNSYLYRSAYWYGFLVRYGLDHNETEVSNDMYDFLQQWLDAHDEMRDNDFYVFGESYGRRTSLL